MSINKVGIECCGCRICKTVCKFDAIIDVTDKYGFEQMKIDSILCHECGKCENVCPILNVTTGNTRFSCGAAYALDDRVKFNGSSGGLFGVFAEKIVSENGIVFGAAFDNNLKLKTVSAETVAALIPLYKSKYLLCDTDNKFQKIKSELENGRKVLYCSSPCQIAALKLFLSREYDNLLTVDFICHGVGNQMLFNKSIEYTQKKINNRIKKVVFRYKAKNNTSHNYCYYYEKDGKEFTKNGIYLSFPYYNAYCKRLVCRIGCFNCKYATESRISDITIGDFHTIEKYDRSIDRFAGISMFICNTDKGEKFFRSVQQELFFKLFAWDIIKENNRFRINDNIPANYDKFLQSIANEPFDKTVSCFLKPTKDILWLIYYKLPLPLKELIKKFIGGQN